MRAIKYVSTALVSLALATPTVVYAQDGADDLPAISCQAYATNCVNNYAALGFATPNECFDTLTDGRCEHQYENAHNGSGSAVYYYFGMSGAPIDECDTTIQRCESGPG